MNKGFRGMGGRLLILGTFKLILSVIQLGLCLLKVINTSLVAKMVKNLPVMQDIQV